MSQIVDRKVKKGNKLHNFHIEIYNGAMEVVEKCRERSITSSSFKNMAAKNDYGEWEGVNSYEEALTLLHDGYQPTVEAMRGVFKAGKMGASGRFSFKNSVIGFAPVVPLALQGVPNCMINMTMKPIKAKVVDVYYDMTVSSGTDSDKIIKAGQTLLGAVVELERQGYRFNLYACQSYNDSKDSDMLVVKLKDAAQPLDLKRISFPLTHTAFFRVIGFDWISKVPGGRHRSGYGYSMTHEFPSDERIEEVGRDLFGKNAVLISASKILSEDKEHLKEVFQDVNSKT